MYSKKRTLAEKITLNSKKVNLPRDAVIDKIILKVAMTLTNGGASSVNVPYQDILKAISEIRVVSDGNTVHYALNGLDVGIMNYYDYMGMLYEMENYSSQYILFPDTYKTIAAGASENVTFVLVLDQGDILAVAKNSLELSMDFETSVYTDVTLDSVEVTITLEENVMTPQEFVNNYGANLEYAAEPKVVAITKSFDASEELREFLDLPTGTLLRKAIIQVYDNSDTLGGVTPDKIGIVVTTPDRRELYTCDFETLADLNMKTYRPISTVNGVVVIDYGAEITNDAYGIRAWKFNKGDYQLAIKSSSGGKVRYVSVEYVVNTKTFDAVERALVEAT
ncbi:hypothetical protein [Archaeoglobus sp.]